MRIYITNKTKTLPVILDNTNIYEHILKICKNKFKIKKDDNIYILNGNILTKDNVHNLQNNQTLLISKTYNIEGIKKSIIDIDVSNVNKAPIKIIGEEFSSLEAIKVLDILSTKEGVIDILALPDLSLTTPCPVGTSIRVRGIIYPSWIGTDIGCGITLFKLKSSSINRNKIYKKLINNYNDKWELDKAREYRRTIIPDKFKELDMNKYDDNLGSIGGGNHFCEIQEDEEGDIYICVHSGSRSLGVGIHNLFSNDLLREGMDMFNDFIEYQDMGIKWAYYNRLMIATRFSECIGLSIDKEIANLCHNFLENSDDNIWIHRKGSIPTNKGPALIPGSRGSHSYLIEANTDTKINSFPHGAGRRYSRKDAEKRFVNTTEEYVICRNKKLYSQEAPDAYKNIDDIMECLKNYNINIMKILKPLITYKC